MFISVYAEDLSNYYNLRSSVLSKSARAHELCYLKRFDSYIQQKVQSRGMINEKLIFEWMRTLQGRKSSSIANEVMTIRHFLESLSALGEKVYLPPTPKVHDDYVPYIFSDEELAKIFDRADNINFKKLRPDVELYMPLQFPVVLRLMYSCGMRLGETVCITLDNVDLQKGILLLVDTKGDKQRLVPLSDSMNEILQKYCLAMGLLGKTSGWLFPSSKSDEHIEGFIIRSRFNYILKEIGLSRQSIQMNFRERGPCLHCLRHVFAFKSFAQSERHGRHIDDTIPYLSIYLGHDSLDETAKYLKFSNEMFPESIDAFGTFMKDLLPEVNYET